MSAMSDVFLRGGDCVEDVNRSECHLRESPEVRIPTSHTIGRAIKELSHEDMEYKSSSGNVFRFNTNPRLNDLLMKLNMKMGLFKSGKNCQRGFRPCFRQDGKSRCDVFVQASLRLFPWRRLNRQYHCVHRKQYGNTSVKFHQADTLSRDFKLLHSYGLHIGTRRMKLLDSNEIRQLRDVCIFEVNGIEVYM